VVLVVLRVVLVVPPVLVALGEVVLVP
jgi:hypothetical protein